MTNMILDFKEIPKPHESNGDQDVFEMFSREFFHLLGYEILSDPNRGADGGKDLVVREVRIGICGKTNVDWLVSCKHKAHTGNSVLQSEEQDISDRVRKNNCKGFIGFYSTIAQSALSEKIQNLPEIEHQIFDREKIERHMLCNHKGIELSQRFFPKSIENWLRNKKVRKLINWDEDDKLVSIELSDKYWVVILALIQQAIPNCIEKIKELGNNGINSENLNEIPTEVRIAYTSPILIRGIIVEELHRAGILKPEAKEKFGINELGEKSKQIMKNYFKKKKSSH